MSSPLRSLTFADGREDAWRNLENACSREDCEAVTPDTLDATAAEWTASAETNEEWSASMTPAELSAYRTGYFAGVREWIVEFGSADLDA